MKNIIVNLIKVWGVKKVLTAVVELLRDQGSHEKQLASDVSMALKKYEERKK